MAPREKQFVDETVPVTANRISYTVKGKRGNQSSGWSSTLDIRFGRVGGTGGGLSILSQTTRRVALVPSLFFGCH